MSENGVFSLVQEVRNGSESSLAIATRVRIMGVDYVRADIADEMMAALKALRGWREIDSNLGWELVEQEADDALDMAEKAGVGA